MAAKNNPNNDTPIEEVVIVEGVQEEEAVPETVTVGGHKYALVQEETKLKKFTAKFKGLTSNKYGAMGVSAAVLVGAVALAAKKRGTTGEETEDHIDSV